MRRPTLLALIALLVVVGLMLYVFDYIKIVDVKGMLWPRLAKLPLVGTYFEPLVLDNNTLIREELENRSEALHLRDIEQEEIQAQIEERQAELNRREQELNFLRDTLDRKDQELQVRATRFDEEETRFAKLVDFFSNMQPAAASQVLSAVDAVTGEPKIDDETIVQILYRMESQTAGYVLSYMPNERASVIVRKIGR